MKEKLWLPVITCLAYCIDKELYKASDYLREQVRVLVEHHGESGQSYSADQQTADEGGGQGKTAQPKDAGAMYRVVHGGY